MKSLFLVLLVAGSALASDLYKLKVKDIKGKSISLNEYKGKTLLFVNIASKCGYTGQLKPLQSLYDRYKEKGLVVIGVPSNEFGGQTPEGNKEMAKFCRLNYGVNFPLLEKQNVKGLDKDKLYQTLLSQSSDKKEVAWNFEKFLVSNSGRVLSRFRSGVDPLSSTMTKAIEKSLGLKE
jgi:glutathione peroxidase